MEEKKYSDIIAELKKQKILHHLLLGNGFSIAYNPNIFSYNSLSNYIEKSNNEFTKKVFDIYKTKNFETVMQELNNMVEVLKAINAPTKLCNRITDASTDLTNQLIEAVSTMHPEHIFEVSEERIEKCFSFLFEYISAENKGNIFYTNYDLLLYWVLMKSVKKGGIFGDGFGESDGYLTWGLNKNTQNIHYVHGALHLFDTGIEVLKIRSNNQFPKICSGIKKNIENGHYPIFVSAGNSVEKMRHITHNKYLNYCYEKLCQISGALITIGFSFGDNDTHIIDAINHANGLKTIYIGTHSESDINHIKSIEKKFENKEVCYFDSKEVEIW